MTFLRSLLFNIIFYPWASLFLLCHASYLFGSRERSIKVLHDWGTHARRLMNCILGLYYNVEGLEHLTDRKILIAAKHQSALDTFLYSDFIEDPCLVVKKELTHIPLYGNFIKKFELIPVDRSRGASALKDLVRKAKQVCFEQDRPIIIFPEGTRTVPGERVSYQPGIVALYSSMKVPVVPVATNSGYFWGRRQFLKRSGMMTIKFLPPIEPGLDRKEFMNRLENVIEQESIKLLDKVKQEKSI